MRPIWVSRRYRTAAAALLLGAAAFASAETAPAFHLTPRPWTPIGISRAAYLDRVESICRAIEPFLDEHGVFWDPATGYETQFSVPYTAFAMGLLVREGRTEPWLRWGTLCMDRATAAFAQGGAAIPDGAGARFVAPLAAALDLYAGHVEPAALLRWRERLRTPLAQAVPAIDAERGYALAEAMSGEWRRAIENLRPRDEATAFVEASWATLQQESGRAFAEDMLVASALSDLLDASYDGPAAASIAAFVDGAAARAAAVQSPPPLGRYAGHVFIEAVRQTLLESAAERRFAAGDVPAAGAYRRAAMTVFAQTERFAFEDGPWKGFFAITANRFDPKERVGYAPNAQIGALTAAMAYHTGRAYLARRADIPEGPTPYEIGGYVAPLTGGYAANAGGLELILSTTGDAMGIARIARVEWDGRLGALGALAPAWRSGDMWKRVDDEPGAYRVNAAALFTHPLLVELEIRYEPATEAAGPIFLQRLTLTPDSLHTTLRCEADLPFALSFALLENDGRPLEWSIEENAVRTRYPGEGDEQFAFAINGAALIDEGRTRRTVHGDLHDLRIEAVNGEAAAFLYPRSPGDPSGADVAASYTESPTGFATRLGAVDGRTYRGRFAAGGLAKEIAWDGLPIVFDAETAFIALREDGLLTAIEAAATGPCRIDGAPHALKAHEPFPLAMP